MTISYNRLGSNGRLGNQMFQYASLRGIANYNQYQWMIPPPDCNHKDNDQSGECKIFDQPKRLNTFFRVYDAH